MIVRSLSRRTRAGLVGLATAWLALAASAVGVAASAAGSVLSPQQPQVLISAMTGGPRQPLLRAGRSATWNYTMGSSASSEGWWYLTHLAVRLQAPAGDTGHYLLSGSNNGLTDAQIEITTTAGMLTVDSLGLVDGELHRTSSTPAMTIDFRNYLQDAATRPGPARLALALQAEDGSGGLTVSVTPATGVELSRVRPDELGVALIAGPLTLRTGRTLRVPFTVVRRGGRPDVPLTVQLRTDGVVRPVGATRRSFAAIGARASGVFEITSTAPGEGLVEIHVLRAYNQPTQRVAVQVSAAPHRVLRPGVVLGALAVGVIALGLAAASTRRRFGNRRTSGSRRPSA